MGESGAHNLPSRGRMVEPAALVRGVDDEHAQVVGRRLLEYRGVAPEDGVPVQVDIVETAVAAVADRVQEHPGRAVAGETDPADQATGLQPPGRGQAAAGPAGVPQRPVVVDTVQGEQVDPPDPQPAQVSRTAALNCSGSAQGCTLVCRMTRSRPTSSSNT